MPVRLVGLRRSHFFLLANREPIFTAAPFLAKKRRSSGRFSLFNSCVLSSKNGIVLPCASQQENANIKQEQKGQNPSACFEAIHPRETLWTLTSIKETSIFLVHSTRQNAASCHQTKLKTQTNTSNLFLIYPHHPPSPVTSHLPPASTCQLPLASDRSVFCTLVLWLSDLLFPPSINKQSHEQPSLNILSCHSSCSPNNWIHWRWPDVNGNHPWSHRSQAQVYSSSSWLILFSPLDVMFFLALIGVLPASTCLTEMHPSSR